MNSDPNPGAPTEVQQALEWFDREESNIAAVIEQLSPEDDSELIKDLALDIGAYYAQRGMWRNWVRVLNPAIVAAQSQSDRDSEAKLRNNLGIAEHNLERPESARKQLAAAITIAEDHGDSGMKARSLASLAAVEKRARRPDLAEDLLREAAALYREAGELDGEAKALGDLANNLDDLLRHEEAVELHLQALERLRELGRPTAEMKELGNLGIAYMNTGQWESAAEVLHQVVELAPQVGGLRDEIAANRDLGLALAHEGAIDDSFSALEKALRLAQEHDLPREEASVLGQRARVHEMTGELDEAIVDRNRAASLLEAVGDPGARGLELLKAAEVELQRGRPEVAAELGERLLMGGGGDLVEARARLLLAITALESNDDEAALNHAMRSADVLRDQRRAGELTEALKLQLAALAGLGRTDEADAVEAELSALRAEW